MAVLVPCPRCSGRGWYYAQYRPDKGLLLGYKRFECVQCWGAGVIRSASNYV